MIAPHGSACANCFVPRAAKWAAAFGTVFHWDIAVMNYLHTKPMFDALAFIQSNVASPSAGEWLQRAAADVTIDATLQDVTLPEGLMTRLGSLAYSVPDGSADQADFLGC